MQEQEQEQSWSNVVLLIGASLVACYFAASAIQGDFGLFQRISAEARLESLTGERDALASEVATLESRTRRLSDDFLDLDLLDQQLRARLGYLRADEVVLR